MIFGQHRQLKVNCTDLPEIAPNGTIEWVKGKGSPVYYPT